MVNAKHNGTATTDPDAREAELLAILAANGELDTPAPPKPAMTEEVRRQLAATLGVTLEELDETLAETLDAEDAKHQKNPTAVINEKYRNISVVIVDDDLDVSEQLFDQLIAIGVPAENITVFESAEDVKAYARSFVIPKDIVKEHIAGSNFVDKVNRRQYNPEVTVKSLVPERLIIFQDNDCPKPGSGIKAMRALEKIMPGNDIGTIIYSGNPTLPGEKQWSGIDSQFLAKPWLMDNMQKTFDAAIAQSEAKYHEHHFGVAHAGKE